MATLVTALPGPDLGKGHGRHGGGCYDSRRPSRYSGSRAQRLERYGAIAEQPVIGVTVARGVVSLLQLLPGHVGATLEDQM